MECERLHASIKNLYAKNAALRKELHDRMDECDKMIEDNDSLLVCHLNPYLSSYFPVTIDF